MLSAPLRGRQEDPTLGSSPRALPGQDPPLFHLMTLSNSHEFSPSFSAPVSLGLARRRYPERGLYSGRDRRAKVRYTRRMRKQAATGAVAGKTSNENVRSDPRVEARKVTNCGKVEGEI